MATTKKQQSPQISAADAQERVNRLSNQSADLHQRVTRAEDELANAREQVANGEPRATDQVVRLTQRLADLRSQLSETENELLTAARRRDEALAREELASAHQQAEKAPELRELVDQRARAADRVQAAAQEFADAVKEADDIAWQLRRKGGQAVAGEAVSRMLQPRILQGALWTVLVDGQPLGRRLGVEKPHKPASFAEADRGFRNRLLANVSRVEARPAELEAVTSEKEAA